MSIYTFRIFFIQTWKLYWTMVHICWGPRSIWTFFVLVLSQRLLTAQIDQYYEVSQETFLDIVVYNCERFVSHSGTIMECAMFCSAPGRPRCFALALNLDFCWVCGEDISRPYTVGDATEATEFWLHSGRYEKYIYKCTGIMHNSRS